MRKFFVSVVGIGAVLLAFPQHAKAQYYEWVTVNGSPVIVVLDPYGTGAGSDGKCKLDDCKDVDPFSRR